MQKPLKILGMMSGTSLDGLDLALCEFYKMDDARFQYNILAAETIPYSENWQFRLKNAFHESAVNITRLDFDYGRFLGELAKDFLLKNHLECDFISSHGHTIFHNPTLGYTLQIGKGSSIAAFAGIDTISDFRSGDVALGGQGAPLVPIGDSMLFSEYDACLNLGGIANISFKNEGKIHAFDICACNIVLNFLANQVGLKYDTNGNLAQSGNIIPELFGTLNNLSYYQKNPPKSLGYEQVESDIFPLLKIEKFAIVDLLRTFVEHIAFQCSREMKNASAKKVLVSGGGAHHHFLIQRLKELSHNEVVIPHKLTVDFKEALIFAFLGYLRLNEIPNCLRSVTGANIDSFGGAVWKGRTRVL